MRLPILLVLAACAFSQQPANHPPAAPAASAITVEALEARLAGLEKGRAQALADLSAYDGAIQECSYWLDLAKKAKDSEASKPAPTPGDPKAKPEQPKPKPDAAKHPAP